MVVSLIKKPIHLAPQQDEATRRLCAGVYRDRALRDRVVRKVLLDTRHLVAPSHGFDLVAVADHAWRSWVLDAVQHTSLVAILAITALCNPAAAVTAVCALCLCPLIQQALRLAPDVLDFQAKRLAARFRPNTDVPRPGDGARRLRLMLASCTALVILPVFSSGAARTPFLASAACAGTALAFAIAVTALLAMARDHSVTVVRTGHRLRPARLNRRLRAVDDQQSCHIVVYSRPRRKTDDLWFRRRSSEPHGSSAFFVGSGGIVYRWATPLTIPLLRPRDGSADASHREYPTPPFELHQLVARLRTRMRVIGDTADPGRLPGCQVGNRLYVAEPDLPDGDYRRLLEAGSLGEAINDPDSNVQHFLETSVTSTGELVTTAYLRVTIKGRSLNLHFATCALTRTPVEFQDAGPSGAKALARSALRGVSRLPAEASRSWRILQAPVLLALYGRACVSRHRPRRAPRLSIREEQATPWDEAVADHATVLEQLKIIEKRLLQTTLDFLRTHKVDTSTFEKTAETVINASVFTTGGRVDINNSAVGPNAQVNQNGNAPQPAAQGAEQ